MDGIIRRKMEEEREVIPPNQAIVDGIVPQRLDFAADQTFKTPRRQIKQKMDNRMVSNDVLYRWYSCTGFPIQFYNADSENDNRNKCSLCGKKTSWYCIGCRAYFCLTSSKRTQIEDLYYVPTFTEDGFRKDDRIFHKSCYHRKHAEAYKKAVQIVQECLCQPVINESREE